MNQINLAVEEVFINIANYAYSPKKGSAVISISAGKDIQLKFEDSGKAYNPLAQAIPDFEKPSTEREIGGLGVFLVKKYMDTVDYARIDDKNVLSMSKRLL
jgi:anti-sigma regulatory factor (Ser/Thr protein kinase)